MHITTIPLADNFTCEYGNGFRKSASSQETVALLVHSLEDMQLPPPPHCRGRSLSLGADVHHTGYARSC